MSYPFSRHYGEGKVPKNMLSPASHFQWIKRTGQASTAVFVEDQDGFIGVGECFGLPSPTPSCNLIEEIIAPAMAEQEIADIDTGTREFIKFFVALGNTTGPAMEAVAGLDIALWDLQAKRQNVPLAQLLGGVVSPIPAYVSPIPFCDDPAESAAKAESYVDEGFRSIKLKVGRRIECDAAHVSAVRSVMPSDAALMLDVNCAYDTDTAIALAAAVADQGIAWIEEPLHPENLDGLKQLCKQSAVPIAAGENLFTLSAFRALVQAGVSILQPNVSRALGVSGMIRIDGLAQEHGCTVAPHGVGASVSVATTLHCCAALKTLTMVESNRLLNPLRDAVGVDFSTPERGCLAPPSGAGHGGAAHFRKSTDVLDPSVLELFEAAER